MLSSLPNFISLFSLYYWSRRSDKKRERFFHTQSSLALSIIGLILCSIFLYLHNLPLFVVSVTVYSIGFWAGESIFITYLFFHFIFFIYYHYYNLIDKRHGVSSVVGSPAIGIALYNAIFTSGGWLGPCISFLILLLLLLLLFFFFFIFLILIYLFILIIIKMLLGY